MLQLANCNHGVKNKAQESRTTPWVLVGGGLCLEGKHICDPWLAILHPFTFFFSHSTTRNCAVWHYSYVGESQLPSSSCPSPHHVRWKRGSKPPFLPESWMRRVKKTRRHPFTQGLFAASAQNPSSFFCTPFFQVLFILSHFMFCLLFSL